MIRVGTSGWLYPPWRGAFYPKGLPHRRELEYISRRLNSVEINGSFYSLQRPTSYQAWSAQTPDDFVFAVKGGRFITHMKRLRDVETPLANFFASGLLALGRKLGPVLWQLPPTLRFDPDLLAAFFDLLPRTTARAAELAAGHDDRLRGRTWLTTDADRPIRHALEVRHPTFTEPAFLDLLRAHDIALVVADTAGTFPYLEDVTTDFAYVRLHGDVELYTSGYSDDALDVWAKRIRALATAAAGDAYVYFDNDVKAHAPHDAIGLAERLGLTTPSAAEPSR
ncbi:MAG TPA: DUF72 domain-containing protein [Actinophytocola sp.]|uniref:DUF72 domain-containing protein n=1 Tax=Actinophytocola sp. TaxID=1872138 RepID=UPI002DDD871D|nr:DUF72 domain-containing protein [Actinophytocola sp.]HEV2779139.1 DUF72 domain-containing protein [Actinophytocola sp.]